jgi:hypothetical protein
MSPKDTVSFILPLMPKVVRCSAGWLCLAAHIHALRPAINAGLVLQTRPWLRPRLTMTMRGRESELR